MNPGLFIHAKLTVAQNVNRYIMPQMIARLNLQSVLIVVGITGHASVMQKNLTYAVSTVRNLLNIRMMLSATRLALQSVLCT